MGPLRTVFLPSALLMIAMVNLTLIVVGLPELIVDELGGTAADASWFISVEMFAYILFAPIWGLLSDRWGRRRPLVVVGFLFSGVLYGCYLGVTDIPTLLALRFLQGMFSVMGWSTLMAMVLDQPDESRRGRYMGIMGASLIFGVSMGAPLGGVIGNNFGIRAPLAVAGVLFAIAALVAFLLPEPKRLRRQVPMTAIAQTLSHQPRLLIPYLFQFVDRYTVGFFIVLFPQYLATLGVSDLSLRGQYLALFLLPFALLQYFTGRLTERIGPYKPLFVGSFLYGIAMCGVGYADLYGLWWVMAILGVLAAIMFPPAILLTAQLSDSETRASAMGGFNLAGSLGFAVGPLVGNWAFSAGGFGLAFVVGGALEILVAIAAILIVSRWSERSPAGG